MAEAVDGADLWIVAIPTKFLREVLTRIAPLIGTPPAALSLVKGVEIGTLLRPTEVIAQLLGCQRVAVLSGPSHAEEVSCGLPTSLVAASTDFELGRWLQLRFTTDRFRVYTN